MTAAAARRRTVVVVGSGIAGITAARAAAHAGARVQLVTKGPLDAGSTAHAQGGIAAVMFDDDRIGDHARDTLTAGAGLCDAEAVRVLVTEGPERVRDLMAAGVAFDRDADGTLVKGLEAAHGYPRILHAGGDATGRAIEDALIDVLARDDVETMPHTFAADLMCEHGRVRGVTTIGPDRERHELCADAVILATGGAGQLFRRTTNPPVATGDGLALALRAGAVVADMEFIQFHPTVLATGPAFLVSEAVRGEGAVIRDETGRRFLLDAHPDGELAPRDVVARAIAARMAGQGGRPVALDATGVHAADAAARARFLARRFPTIDAAVRAAGIDWSRAAVPVAPAAHYVMGGVATDLRGRTSIAGLYAVGEVARTGVHGANRLASNSLLEGAVFGRRAGYAAAEDRPEREVRVRRPVTVPSPHVTGGDSTADVPAFQRAGLQRLMWTDAGVARTADGLEHASRTLDAWAAQRRTPRTVREHEDENLLTVARAVVAAASARVGSVGAHARLDDPATPRRRADSAPLDAAAASAPVLAAAS